MRMGYEVGMRKLRSGCNDAVASGYRTRMGLDGPRKWVEKVGRIGLDSPTRITPSPQLFSSYSVVLLLHKLIS